MRLREFTVTGKGEFPLDMLRYDQCYPKREGEDVRAVYESVRGFSHHSMPWQVTLVTVKDSAPTVGRWESFGWSVLP